jgi:hypothetical protein
MMAAHGLSPKMRPSSRVVSVIPPAVPGACARGLGSVDGAPGAGVAGEEGATVDGAELDGAELDGAELDGAEVDGAGVDGAELDGAELDGAGVDGAELDGAGVDGAELDGAEPDGAAVDGAGLVVGGLVVSGAAGAVVVCAPATAGPRSARAVISNVAIIFMTHLLGASGVQWRCQAGGTKLSNLSLLTDRGALGNHWGVPIPVHMIGWSE